MEKIFCPTLDMWHGDMALDTRGKLLMGLHGKDARGHFCPK
jgi:hypothetical protein